jgi:FdhD protein
MNPSGVATALGKVEIRRYSAEGYRREFDEIVREEPLEIRISYHFKGSRRTESAAVTMRTPGHEIELAAGFLYSEYVIAGRSDVEDLRLLGTNDSNEVLVELASHVDVDAWRLRRATILSSACGICGKRAIEALPQQTTAARSITIARNAVFTLSETLRRAQTAFDRSGGLHAAGLFTPAGELLSLFEDVGRHNALDKLIGRQWLEEKLPLNDTVVFMSSRGSFELVQKVLAAGGSVLATVGAPSSLAVEFASDRGLTLIGFVRDDHFNVYTGEWRVD